MVNACFGGSRRVAIEAGAFVSAVAARREDAAAKAAFAWAPPGYDATDLRILDWIVAHRRGPHAKAAIRAA